MISDELSNAVFRFSLRCLRAKLDGGASKRPPRAVRGRRIPPAVRGLMVNCSVPPPPRKGAFSAPRPSESAASSNCPGSYEWNESCVPKRHRGGMRSVCSKPIKYFSEASRHESQTHSSSDDLPLMQALFHLL